MLLNQNHAKAVGQRVSAATLAFAQYLGLPRKVPAAAESVKRVVSNGAARAAKAVIPVQSTKAVAGPALEAPLSSKPAIPAPRAIPREAPEANRTSIRQLRSDERERCVQIMDAALRANCPRLGVALLKFDGDDMPTHVALDVIAAGVKDQTTATAHEHSYSNVRRIRPVSASGAKK
jgi:hypothetical protein